MGTNSSIFSSLWPQTVGHAAVTRNLNLDNSFISYESNTKNHTTVILSIISGNFEGDILSPYISERSHLRWKYF